MQHAYSKNMKLPKTLYNILYTIYPEKFETQEMYEKVIKMSERDWVLNLQSSTKEKFDYNVLELKRGLDWLIKNDETRELDEKKQAELEQINNLKPF
jgi:hypothetical protein